MTDARAIKIAYLIEKIRKILEQELKEQGIAIDEYFDVISRFLEHACQNEARCSISLDVLEENERKVLSFLRLVIEPPFEERRKQLYQQSPASTVKQKQERLCDQMKDMMREGITPAEGLFLAGEVISFVTLLHTPNVKAEEQVQDIEKHTLSYVKGKLTLALDTIRVQQGLVSKH